MDQLPALKKELYNKCKEYVENRIHNIREALNSLKESADEETKSSVGDKYETGRAMMQIEMENYSSQLQEARKLQQQIERISPKSVSSSVEAGSVVITNAANYYFAISIGKITVEGKDFFVVSPASPIGEKMANKRAGDEIELNGRKIKITAIA